MNARRAVDPVPAPWAIYARLSKAQEGGLDKVADQVKLCLDYAEAHDIPTDPALVFTDNSLSAWRKNVKRPEWDRMMKMAEADQLPGILVWEVSRFCRRPMDAEKLIQLAEGGSMTVAGPGGRHDLTTPEGRKSFRDASSQAAYESDTISKRSKLGLARKMRDGMPFGGSERVFGFEEDLLTQRPEEAAVIVEVAQRMLSGESLASLARELTERGVRTVTGRDFNALTLRQVMWRSRNGGEVEHENKVVGTMPGEPILDRETYDAVRAELQSRRRGRPATGRHLLSGIVQCGRCKPRRTLNGITVNKGDRSVRTYKCVPDRGGCGLTVLADPVEALVAEHMTALMADTEFVAGVASEEAHLSAARAERQTTLAAIEAQLVSLEVKWAAGELDKAPRAYDQAKATLDKRYAAAQKALDDVGGAGHLLSLAVPSAGDWATMTPEEQRKMIEALHVSIAVKPGTGGHFQPKRVVITRAQPRKRSRRS